MKWLGCGVLIVSLWLAMNAEANAQTIVPCAPRTIEPSCLIPPYAPNLARQWGCVWGDCGAVADSRSWLQIAWEYWF